MKALSLWQPWATAIALGAKRIETRSWETNYRGPLAIHAAKRWNADDMEDVCDSPAWQGVLRPLRLPMLLDAKRLKDILPLGCIVATCRLVACLPTNSFDRVQLHAARTPKGQPNSPCFWTEYELGDFSPGRFGWVLEDIQPIQAIPYTGHQGLFEVPQEIIDAAVLLPIARE